METAEYKGALERLDEIVVLMDSIMTPTSAQRVSFREKLLKAVSHPRLHVLQGDVEKWLKLTRGLYDRACDLSDAFGNEIQNNGGPEA